MTTLNPLNTYFKDEKEFTTFKKGFLQSSSFYKEAKAKFATSPELVTYFIKKTPKEIYEDLFTDEKERIKYPMIENRKRTPIGDQINNLKRYAKKLANEASDQPVKKKIGNGLLDYLRKLLNDIDESYTNDDLTSLVKHLTGSINEITKIQNKREQEQKEKTKENKSKK